MSLSAHDLMYQAPPTIKLYLNEAIKMLKETEEPYRISDAVSLVESMTRDYHTGIISKDERGED